MTTYHIEDTIVSAVATLMGCKPSNGLVNRLNKLEREGALAKADTIGDLYRAVLLDMVKSAMAID